MVDDGQWKFTFIFLFGKTVKPNASRQRERFFSILFYWEWRSLDAQNWSAYVLSSLEGEKGKFLGSPPKVEPLSGIGH